MKKHRRFLATIATILALLIALSSTSVAMGQAADAVQEMVSAAETTEASTFDYPEETDPSVEGIGDETNTDSELRLPDVTTSESPEEAQYGEAIIVDEYTKVYQTGDRNFRTVYSEIPNTFENALGEEVEYDNTLVLEEKLLTADYYTAAASDIEVQLPAEDSRNFDVEFEYDGVKVKMKPQDGDYSRPAVKQNAILYNDVFDGIDIQYTVNALGMKEDIILNKYVSQNTFAYKLDISGADYALENGVINLYDDEQLVLTISAPIMTDANGSISDGVTLTLEEDILTVTADAEWIASPERAYPIKIDPNLTIPASKLDVVTVSEHHGRYASKAYGYVGDLTAEQIGVPGSKDLGRTRMYFEVNDDFTAIPEGSKINSAALRIYQYTNMSSSTQLACFRVEDSYNIDTIDFEKAITLNESIAGENAVLSSGVGFHEFDIRQTVNDWVQGIAPNYGLSVRALDEYMPAGAFFTPYSSSGNGGQGSFTEDKAPQIIIDWEVPNPVDPNYPLDNTTINLRTIIETSKDGKLYVHGVFADGVAQPGASVTYRLNDSSKGQNGTMDASPSYKYPDSSSFEQYFPPRATKYKDIQSNWQTALPFTDHDFDTIYYYEATASKDGTTGNTAKSDEYLVYKIKQYDVLPQIASYYGVPLSQIMFDNRVQDILLIEDNTIIVRNPTKNGNRPYNPEPLDDTMKRRVDSLLMGRGKHCEFGFEPINLNTGNFYMNQTDISIADFNGDFDITRTYNSLAAGYNSVFGRGWQFEYSEAISRTAEGEYVYSRGDGSKVYFTPDGRGGYTCPEGYYLTFSPVKVGTKEGDFGGEALESYDVYEYEIREADGTVRRFDSMGLLVKITDPKGFVTTLSYDDNYRLSSLTSPAGASYAFAYTADGYISAITMPDGNQLTYGYDDNNNLVSFTDAAGNKISYAYDNAHRMTSWSDANGDVVNVNEYDSEGRVTKQTDGNGNVTTLAYGENTTTTTDANGNVTVYHYDSSYRTTKIEYADGSFEEKFYNAHNELSAEIDRNGNRTKYEYDDRGNLIKQTRLDGAVSTFAYNADNQLTQTVDYNGAVTKYIYSNKDLISIEYADGSTVSYEYDDQHRITKEIDSNGNVTTYAYDGAWLASMTNPNGGVNHYYYNAHGQIVSIVDALGQTTRFVYDDAGRKVQQQTFDGAVTKFGYDAAGNMVSTTDANGNVFSYESDANGNIIKATDPLGNVTVYAYDGLNNQATETDPAGKTTSYAYDCFSQLVSVTDADGNTTAYAYDGAGNQISTTTPNGYTTRYGYDLRFNQLASVTYADGSVSSNTYDAVGNLTQSIAVDGTTQTYSYDLLNQMIESTDAAGLHTTYAYDANGNLLRTEDSTGRVTTYVYDNMDNLTSSTLPSGAVLTYEYDLLGRMISSTDANGGKTTYTYDGLSRLVSSTDPLGRTTSYTYDGMGNMLTYTAANEGVMTYEYNALDLVTKVTDVLGNFSAYTYDASGNLSALTDVYGNATKYEYNGRNLVTKVTDARDNSYAFAYDANGNQIKITAPNGTETVMEYDALDRLVKTTDAEGLVVTYEYNQLGQLIAERNNAGRETLYAYDEAGRVSTITDGLGQTIVYTYDEHGNVTSIKGTDGTTTKYAYDAADNVVSITDPEGKTTAYTYDLAGNLLKTTDYDQRVWQYAYDAANRLIAEINPLEEETSYEYNLIDFLTKTTNAAGIATVNEYDLAGNLIATTDGNGNKTSYEYDGLYRLIAQVATDGGRQEYLYDEVSNLISYKDGLGNITSYSYDNMNRAVQMTRPTGGTYTYGYNNHGLQTSIADPYGNTTSQSYDLNGSLVKKTLANGAEYTYAYDAIGRITNQTAPEGLSRAYTYDSAGNLAAETDQSGRTTTYAYDIMHRLVSSTNAKGSTTSFAYDNRGNITTLTTPRGSVTQYEYDVLDRISKSIDPVSRTESYTYDEAGNVASITKTGGRVYTYTHDNVGNLLSITDPLNQTQSYAYDAMNRQISETDAAGKSQSYTYDYNGQLTSITNKLGGVTSFGYDGNGNLVSLQDAEGRKASYTYDLADRLVSVTEADILTAEYEYDSVGNLIAATNGNGKTTNYTYDLLGNMTSITDPLGNVKQFAYDVNAQLQTITNPDGTTVDYDYDELDQLVQKSYDDTDVQAMYGFDADGNRISMDDVAGTTNYEYDAAGRITAVILPDGERKIKYTYDKYGNLYELQYPDGSCVVYDYDELDRLVRITDRDSDETTYEYDANGNVTKVNRPNNTYTEIAYDDMGNVASVKNMRKVRTLFKEKTEEISSFAYTYDTSGLIKSELAKQGDKLVERNFAYDGRGQISTVAERISTTCGITWDVYSTQYTYDNAGNKIKEETLRGPVVMNYTDYTYNDADQLTERTKTVDLLKLTTKYTYDANGNLIKDDDCYHGISKHYSYDHENRLEAVRSGGRLLMAALYSGDGDRIFALNSYASEGYVTNGKGTALDVYSGVDFCDSYEYDREMVKDELLIPNEISIWNASQYELTGYINDVNTEYTQVLMEFGSNGRWSNVYDYGVQRNSVNIKNGEKAYYLYDGRGSVANLTSQRGASMVYYEYNIYGEADASRAGVHNPYQYNAEYTDAATGLQYLRARYYDPETSRFMTKDTYLGEINDPLSRNLYTYTCNNPINLIDPSGHIGIGAILLIAGVAITAISTVYTTYKETTNRNERTNQIRSELSTKEQGALDVVHADSAPDVLPENTYYNARDKKLVTFKTAAEYYEYKELCEELDELDKGLVSTIIHNTLDLIGFVPGYGEIADGINAAFYFAEGDNVNGGLSLAAAAIPIGGDLLGKGGRVVDSFVGSTDDIAGAIGDIAKQGDNIGNALKNIDNADGLIDDVVDSGIDGLWNQGWSQRGFDIDEALGNNLGRTYPTIDKISEDGIITSIKSMNTSSGTYLTESGMYNKIKSYVDEVANYTVSSELPNVTGRQVELAIPDQALNDDQIRALKKAKEYAASSGVDLKITVVQ